MNEKTITEKLQEALKKEASTHTAESSKLSESIAKFSKLGINTKSSYNLPLKDTIGHSFRKQFNLNLCN